MSLPFVHVVNAGGVLRIHVESDFVFLCDELNSYNQVVAAAVLLVKRRKRHLLSFHQIESSRVLLVNSGVKIEH